MSTDKFHAKINPPNVSGGHSTQQSPGITSKESREQLLEVTGSDYTKIRHILVQHPAKSIIRCSSLSKIVSARKHRALILYLFVLANWTWISKKMRDEEEPLHAKSWVRALNAPEVEGSMKWSESSLSKAWTHLEELGLMKIGRVKRLVVPQINREDSAQPAPGVDVVPYAVPDGKKKDDEYFILPNSFWLEGHYAKLSLPALAILLVILKETNGQDDATLRLNRFEDWYGLKPSSVNKGKQELEALGWLKEHTTVQKSAFHPDGKEFKHHYSLVEPYSHEHRKSLQQRAKAELHQRTKKP